MSLWVGTVFAYSKGVGRSFLSPLTPDECLRHRYLERLGFGGSLLGEDGNLIGSERQKDGQHRDTAAKRKRVSPLEGFYLYCVRKSRGASSVFLTKGIDEKGEVFTRTYQRLEAVVSLVPLDEFDSEIIHVKARNDLQWIKEKAVLHETVIEEAMRNGGEILSLIPMKFGTIFKEERHSRRP